MGKSRNNIIKGETAMSGIDKIEYTVPIITSRNSREGCSLSSLLETATSNGLIYICKRLPNEKKYVIGFSGYDGLFICYDSKFKYTINSQFFVKKIILNPSRFRSYNEMIEVLGRLGTSWIHGGATVASRIDFAADYLCPMDKILASLDVLNIQKSSLYIGENCGGVETYYAGRNNDVISVYNRNTLFLAQGREYEIIYPDCIRIERQLRDMHSIFRKFGYHITPLNIAETLRDISSGGVNIFSDRVDLKHLNPINLANAGNEKEARQQTLLTLASFASYSVARRRLNVMCNDNFQRQYANLFQRIPFADYNQPNYILQKSVTEYMGITPRLPIPSETAEALYGLYRRAE